MAVGIHQGERLVELADLSEPPPTCSGRFVPTWIDITQSGNLLVGGPGHGSQNGLELWVKTIDKSWAVTSVDNWSESVYDSLHRKTGMTNGGCVGIVDPQCLHWRRAGSLPLGQSHGKRTAS